MPTKRFRKEIIKVGDYYKPADNLSFTVTPRTLEHWTKQFERMKAAGVKVPIPAGHEHAGDPEFNYGFVSGLGIDGDRLIADCTLHGQDAIDAAARNDVSIYAVPEYVDGLGNRYEWPIVHLAICPDPLIPGLGPFEALAASRGPGDGAVVQRARQLAGGESSAAGMGLSFDDVLDSPVVASALRMVRSLEVPSWPT